MQCYPGRGVQVKCRSRCLGTDLELPLRRHDLRVDAGDLDARVHARLQVRLHDVAPDGRARARAACAGAAVSAALQQAALWRQPRTTRAVDLPC